MLKSGRYFVYAILVWKLYGEVKSEDHSNQCGGHCLTTILPLIEPHAKLINLWYAMLAEMNETQIRLDEILNETTSRLENLEIQQAEVESHLKGIHESITGIKMAVEEKEVIWTKVIPPYFEKFGSRYFRIVQEEKNLTDAAYTCRKMGGHLASFQNQEEFDAISAKYRNQPYWLGINNRVNSNNFVSLTSGKAVKFLKWRSGQPVLYPDKDYRYVYMADGKMSIYTLLGSYYFICQADEI